MKKEFYLIINEDNTPLCVIGFMEGFISEMKIIHTLEQELDVINVSIQEIKEIKSLFGWIEVTASVEPDSEDVYTERFTLKPIALY